MANSFGSKSTLKTGGAEYTMHRLGAVYRQFPQAERLPFSLKVLLENLLRCEDDLSVFAADIEALAKWDAQALPSKEIAFRPAS